MRNFCKAVVFTLCSIAASAANAEFASFEVREGWQVQGMNGLWRSDTDVRVLKCSKGLLHVYLRPDVVSEDGLCLFTKTVSGSLDRVRGFRAVGPNAASIDGIPVLIWSDAHDRWERP